MILIDLYKNISYIYIRGVDIVNRIKELRNKKGIKQADLANFLGVVQGTLSYWENDKFDVDNASLQKLADYFNVSTDYILGRTDDPPLSQKKVSVNDKDLKIAFWGNPNEDDELLEDVRSYAQFVKDRKEAQRKKDEKPD